ncbi:uncharacterized protein H6S33_009384 [Morchella sextelata]|uniref:uncharacterized protein n=1 Tax=Morchella sextelata TaxID=1174677 RepID=UPI001D04BBED|nr:uncharacterized protein H6S33_009384 [Morchella sextelata]KAH0613004.1 hypothetical protein H6S33_009384 [Morchella sextelata]
MLRRYLSIAHQHRRDIYVSAWTGSHFRGPQWVFYLEGGWQSTTLQPMIDCLGWSAPLLSLQLTERTVNCPRGPIKKGVCRGPFVDQYGVMVLPLDHLLFFR